MCLWQKYEWDYRRVTQTQTIHLIVQGQEGKEASPGKWYWIMKDKNVKIKGYRPRLGSVLLQSHLSDFYKTCPRTKILQSYWGLFIRDPPIGFVIPWSCPLLLVLFSTPRPAPKYPTSRWIQPHSHLHLPKIPSQNSPSGFIKYAFLRQLWFQIPVYPCVKALTDSSKELRTLQKFPDINWTVYIP